MTTVTDLSFLTLLLMVGTSAGFVAPFSAGSGSWSTSALWSSLKEENDIKSPTSADDPAIIQKILDSSSELISPGDVSQNKQANPDAEGLPWWWELVWKLDMMKTGEPGKEIIFGDSANVLRTNIEQIYGGYPSLDGCPLAEGEINDIGDGTMFVGLQNYFENYGSPYKLCFGPKSFLVISDPIQARHVLKDANSNYDKVRKIC
jgi:hypothetical protein